MRPGSARVAKGDLFSRQQLGKHQQPLRAVELLLQFWPLDRSSPEGPCAPLAVPGSAVGAERGPAERGEGGGGDGRCRRLQMSM